MQLFMFVVISVNMLYEFPRVYNKEGGRVSYSSIVPCTAVVRVQARLMIFIMCGVTCHCGKPYTRSHATRLPSCVNCESTTRCEYH